MKLDFIITGLPRTKKAWLANYLTNGNVYCGFEVFREGPDNIDIFLPDGEYMSHHDIVLTGAADTSAALYQDRIMKDYPDLQWIILERDYQDVSKSVKNLGFSVNQGLHDLSVKLAELRSKHNPLVVKSDELFDSIEGINRELGIPYDSQRLTMLKELNVSAHSPRTNSSKTPIEPAGFTPKNKAYMEVLLAICEDNMMAYQWLRQVIEAALVWDHVVDQDATDFIMLDRVFKSLLLEWALNPFWLTNSKSLLPVLSSSISNWQCSYLPNMIKDKAYSIYEDVPSAVAFILGGQPRVDKFMPILRTLVKDLRQEDDIRDGGKK